MLPQDAFLRLLPAIADDEGTLRCDALLFAADSVALCHETIRAITARSVEDPSRITPAGRVRIFNAAWSIVDQLHAALLLLRSMGFDKDFAEVRDFVGRFGVVRQMRNKMDHLPQGMGNHAADKSRKPPIFGALLYLAVPPSDLVPGSEGVTVKAVTSVVLMSGRVGGRLTAPVINPANKLISPPTCCFRLCAFKEELDIDAAAAQLGELMRFLNVELEKRLRSQAVALAESLGRPLDKLLAHLGNGLTVCMRFGASAENPGDGAPPD